MPSATLRAPETRSIAEYYRYTRRLIEDIDNAIDDLSFRRDGGELVWAVDFTEIEAFVLPDERGERSATDAALDIAVLERFFFGTAGDEVPQVVLLPPHRVELRNAEAFFQQEALVRFQNLVTRATLELQQLQMDTTFDALLRQLEVAAEEPERTRLETALIAYLNDHAGALFLSLTQVNRTPQGRLRELLQRARLVDLSSIIGRVVLPETLDGDLLRDLATAIFERRIDHRTGSGSPPDDGERERQYRSSTRDATAVSYVGYANQHFEQAKQRRRMVLMTRSEVVISEAGRHSTSLGAVRVDRLLRRIGAFRQATIMPDSTTLTQRIEELLQRRRALELAIKALRTFTGSPALQARSEHAKSDFQRHVAHLTELWEDLAVATVPWTSQKHGDPGAPVLELLRNKDRLNELIRQAAAQLATDINLNNAMLGFFEGEGRHRGGSTSFVERPVARNSGHAGVLIWSRDTVSTIALVFYDPILARRRGEGQDGTRLLRRLLGARLRYEREEHRNDRTLPDAERQPRLVESCLASSFLEAVEDRWDTALIFADMAANWPTHLDATPRHESLYMRAVSRRRAEGPSEQVLRACLGDLATASDGRHAAGLAEDPRYLLQEGICYFGLWEHVDGGKLLDVNAPTLQQGFAAGNSNIDRAIALFEKARLLVERQASRSASTNRLMLDIANARCYAHISARGPDDQALRLYTELLKAMRDCGWDEETVPVSQLDTLVWTMFLLRERLGETAGIVKLARALARRFPQFQHHAEDSAIVDAHLRDIGLALGVDLLAGTAADA